MSVHATYKLRTLLCLIAFSIMLPSIASAQGRADRVFNGFDYWWEARKAHHPALHQLDNRDWKTWIAHSVVSMGVGYAIGAATPLRAKQGVQIMLVVYGAREIYNIAWGGNRRYFDAVMDVAVPYVVYRVWF